MASKELPSESLPTEDDVAIILACHDEAFLYISQGLSYEENKKFDLACNMYHMGLQKIDIALNVRCDKQHCIGKKWDDGRSMQQKMRKVRQQIQSQLQNIAPNKSEILYLCPEQNEPPPLYSEATNYSPVSTMTHSPDFIPNSSIYPKERKMELPADGVSHPSEACEYSRKNSAEVMERFCIPSGVLLFFVPSDGSVSTSISTTSLHIYQFIDEKNSVEHVGSRPPAWLQVGSWTYPLIPGQSPSLESSYGAFMFPDLSAEMPGSSVGIILPASVSTNKRKEFENVLAELTVFEEEKPTTSCSLTAFKDPSISEFNSELTTELNSLNVPSYGESLSKGIVIGAEYLSAALIKGATLASDLIHKGAIKIKEHVHPEGKPVVIDPKLKQGLKLAKDASGVALKASNYLVQKLGEMTIALARQLAPHVQHQGSKLLTSAFNKDPQEAKETMDGVLTIAAGGLVGVSTVYLGLENAARTLAASLSSETVNILDHKYGEEAGEIAGIAVHAIGNLALATHNVQAFGAKSIAKRTAKDTGKVVLNNYIQKEALIA